MEKNTAQNQASKVNTAAPVNGTVPTDAATAEAPKRKGREVPTIGVNLNAHQYAFVKEKLAAILKAAGADVDLEVSLAGFVAAHALKSMGYVKPIITK